jgi:hypothetical protein
MLLDIIRFLIKLTARKGDRKLSQLNQEQLDKTVCDIDLDKIICDIDLDKIICDIDLVIRQQIT